jgi:hypothetical protein
MTTMDVIPELDSFESSFGGIQGKENDIGEKLRLEIRNLLETNEFSSSRKGSDFDSMTDLIMNKLSQVAE